MKRIMLSLLLSVGAFLAVARADAPPAIQDQGSSPYCLFAATAHIAGLDMWQLEATYHRRGFPTWDGATPYAASVIALAEEKSGRDIIVFERYDWWGLRYWLAQGRPVVLTGGGHALVALRIEDSEIVYLDSLNPGEQRRSEADLRDGWWDGWAWFAP